MAESSTSTFIRTAPTSFRLVLPSPSPTHTGLKLTTGPTVVNGTDPASTPLLTGAGGPAIIAVFVVCGFLLAFLVTSLFCRARRGRRENSLGDWDDPEEPPSPELAAKPEMSDVHLSISQWQARQLRSSGQWRNMQPLSASTTANTVILPTLTKTKRASISSVDSTYSQDSMSSVPLSPPPRYGMDLNRSRQPTGVTSPKPTNVRVTVPIAMPRPPPSSHNPWKVTSPHDVDLHGEKATYFDHAFTHEEDIPEFCLGVAEVSQTANRKDKDQ
ncbi:hypothetical protein BDW22DRAFT_1487924 [Trametopsis cervina]|nr:hypothetical protein BDW22DRAFT_1487924 [Trametopsis cervina]